MTERETVTATTLASLYERSRGGYLAAARSALLARGVPESVASAEDIVQNAFTKALRNPAAIRHPPSYLHQLIRTEVANRAQQQANHRRLEARRAADPLRRDPVQVADFSALVANRGAVEQAMADLTPAQRTAVWATKALGCTQNEVATLLGRSPGTVATHVSRAVALLRASLVAALVAVIAWAAGGRYPGGHRQRAEPARGPDSGADPESLYGHWPQMLPVLLVASLLALAYGTAVWARRRSPGDGPMPRLRGWLGLRRTRRAWSRAVKELSLPFSALAVTRDSVLFAAHDDADPDTVTRGVALLPAYLRARLGRTVRVEMKRVPARRPRTSANTRLTDLFALAGWSKGELARLVNRQAAAMGHPRLATDTSRVRRWLDLGEIPRDPVPRVLAALFTERLGRVVTIDDLGLTRRGRTSGAPSAYAEPEGLPWAPERTAAVLTEFTGMDLMLNRRGLVGAGAALSAGTAAVPRPPESAGPRLITLPRSSTMETIGVLDAVCRAPQGVLTQTQLELCLPESDPAVTTRALSTLVREGYLQRLPGNEYALAQHRP
ncbi:RNA polymerase sigma factor (sigma-70 family) [Streptomyces sp. PsTaAH-137]|nr:hypothetical protein [Streptomyces sp. SID8367]RAJ79592.1 RNA polymerase sigma factor (sigma-70 family) [Streptomyces sp. PsTaAH-137]